MKLVTEFLVVKLVFSTSMWSKF